MNIEQMDPNAQPQKVNFFHTSTKLKYVKKLTWEQVFQDCAAFSQLLHQLYLQISQ
jgi:hypothetical protein